MPVAWVEHEGQSGTPMALWGLVTSWNSPLRFAI